MGHERHEKYWKRFLLPNEKPIHMFGVSRWYVFVFWVIPAFVILGVAVYVGLSSPLIGLMFGAPAVAMLLSAVYLTYFVHYIVTDQRVMTREGFLYKKFVTVALLSITDMQIYESLLERVFTQTGTIGANTAGGPQIELFFRHIAHPLNRRKDIYKHLQLVEAKNGRESEFAGNIDKK